MRILLADDHALVRAGIRALIEEMEGATIVAEASNGREAVALAKAHSPDVVVMDISMTELNGIEATARIRTEAPGSRVLILSMHTTDDFVRRALKAGASGYLVKDSAPLELRMALDAVLRNEVYLSPRVSRGVVSGMVGRGADASESMLDALTPRQREVLQLIAEGKSTKEIAFALSLSAKTVETHRATLMERLDIHDIAGLVLFAVRHHLVSADRPDL
ncbi:Response regulator UvrY [Usitatibacter rugosus]|uniref:Response regulator UvrY n=1 Tax=Usitatibacter rugosus TaxID=2732067 RepID=A0A6M4GV27_9PROT|nr:response regulator transcription factor [Usitatibacter rugosus]QJR11160.1 Response regulator UvrY [Usitatibacter rugosus]